jgi:malonyl-CoA O-methyltransferase
MQINSALVRRFDAASGSYDRVASVQRQAANLLLQELRSRWPEFRPQKVLELGVGSGYLSQQLIHHFPESQFILNDCSTQMLAQTQQRFVEHAGIQYDCSDFDQMNGHTVDLTISNLALQWSAQLAQTLRTHYVSSKRFAFSGLLQGTFSEWDSLFKSCELPSPVHTYWSQADYERMVLALQPQDYAFATQTLTLSFENAQAVMHYLQQLGASLGQQRFSVAQLRQVIKQQKTPIQLTYHVFFAWLIRSHECESLSQEQTQELVKP